MGSNGLQPTILGCNVINPIINHLHGHHTWAAKPVPDTYFPYFHKQTLAFFREETMERLISGQSQNVSTCCPAHFLFEQLHFADILIYPQDLLNLFSLRSTTALVRHGEERRKLNPSCRTRTHTHTLFDLGLWAKLKKPGKGQTHPQTQVGCQFRLYC